MIKTDSSAPSGKRWWDLPAALLLFSALLTASGRLVATHWTDHLGLTQTLVVIGLVFGLALGYTRFSTRLALLLSTVFAAFFIPWQLGLTLRSDLEWLERLIVLINRLGIILYQLAHKETVYDSLLFIVLMCALFWALSAHAGFALTRYGNPWWCIMPAGLAVFVIHSFDPLISRRGWYMAVYLFFGFVLVARLAYVHNQNRWQTSRTALPPQLGLEFIRFTVVITGLVVIAAWTIPAAANAIPLAQRAWQPIQRRWVETRQRWENFFAPLNPSAVSEAQVFGPTASLGLGTPLADTQIFNVRMPQNLPPGVRLYWRARAYQTYENGQWATSKDNTQNFDPAQSQFTLPKEEGRWVGVFEIVAAINLGTMYTPSQPVWVNRAAQVEYLPNSDGTQDLLTFMADPSVSPGEIYRVQSSINYATVKQLRDAGSEYPAYVSERYLQLPDSITARTRQLAEQITAGSETPYDKAVAITEYLRKNITYVQNLPQEPPGNQEVIDWFLFDLRQGFCNYYATAEVVMLRAVGIPARWAAGYAQGELLQRERDESIRDQPTVYIIRQRDAHAWPEVYFPDIGWVEFEPTVSQPDITRLPGEDRPTDQGTQQPQRTIQPPLDPSELLPPERETPQQNARQNILNVVYWTLSFSLGGVALFLLWRNRARLAALQPAPILLEQVFVRAGIRPPQTIQLWARQARLPPLSKAYQEINYALRRLGKQPAANATPAERAASLGQELPPVFDPAQQLVQEYQVETFSEQPANLSIAQASATQIKRQSIVAYFKRLLARLQRPRQPDQSRRRGF